MLITKTRLKVVISNELFLNICRETNIDKKFDNHKRRNKTKKKNFFISKICNGNYLMIIY